MAAARRDDDSSNEEEEEEEGEAAAAARLAGELHSEAEQVREREPALSSLLHLTVLTPGSERSFEEAVAHTVCYRLLMKSCDRNGATSNGGGMPGGPGGPTTSAASSSSLVFCPQALHSILLDALSNTEITEHGHTMRRAVMEDLRAVVRRDPAMDTALQVLLFSKGFATLVCHRAAFRLWRQRRHYTAFFLQSQCSAVFGLDIHPAAAIGSGVMLDHGTGVVIGETARVGDGCTLLHGVTLGGTGKDHGDRHPKIGNYVLIGAGSSILGNIRVGNNSKIGAGSVVLRDIPAFATAVGAPAKIIGRVAESERPGSDMDETLQNVQSLHKSKTVLSLMKQQQQQQQHKQRESIQQQPPQPVSSSSTGGGGGGDSTVDETASDTSSVLADNLSDDTTTSSSDAVPLSQQQQQQSKAITTTTDNLCPWRQFKALGKSAPPHTITICKLQQLMEPLGCSNMTDVGSCFFALDAHMVGYVRCSHFARHAAAVFPRYCPHLDAAAVQTLVEQVAKCDKNGGCDGEAAAAALARAAASTKNMETPAITHSPAASDGGGSNNKPDP